MRHPLAAWVLCAAALLAGCQSLLDTAQRLPPVDLEAPAAGPAAVAPALPTAALASSAAPGALYQPDRYRPLFEDHRARVVGDTLLVQITEKVSAVQKSTSSLDKSGKVSGGLTALPGISTNSFGRAAVGGTRGDNFAGKGSTESSNDFSGSITASVVRVLPNGHLVVAGEKQIGVNANVDVLRFSGQVDPRAIQPGNSVPSTAIANVRVEQRGRGQQAEAQSMGWLARYFLSLWPI
jgi:flagellar L-ring protein precursor FlgH